MRPVKFRGGGLARKAGQDARKLDVTVVCYDGERTEADYFLGWRRRLGAKGITLKPYFIKSGGNVQRAVEEAVKIRSSETDVENFWCVCDVDSSSKAAIAQGIATAQKHSIRLAASNRSFEVWIACHWGKISTAAITSEKDARTLVARHYGDYQRGVKSVPFDMIFPLTVDALANAEWLKQQGNANPSTDVQYLVSLLLSKL
jgi:hypothetical protein